MTFSPSSPNPFSHRGEKGNRILLLPLLPSCSPLPSLGEGLGVRAGVGEGLGVRG
ncbi:hypothetical protein MC7420_460 [Coleofasciculus chthonoplastes PCC 7420]|uniref:Uncharacterized protein n=1 Tax=Coleofasciculus chthonoplastes PCC 7420 TaxID=118168 RepID=B4VLR4_9CYAN|nr:hypothetical protein MC7420_460 [Coleofasciculus chthonoplastes PCC 7420]